MTPILSMSFKVTYFFCHEKMKCNAIAYHREATLLMHLLPDIMLRHITFILGNVRLS